MEDGRNNIKPPRGLTVQLFLFMLLVLVMASGLKDSFGLFFNNPLESSNRSLLLFSGIIDLLAYSYGFLAIYKTLQRKPYSIMMLKLSVFYILIQLFFRMIGRVGDSFVYSPLVFLPVLFFCLFFFIYLYRSKNLKLYLPKSERRWGIWGWLGVGLYLLVVIMYGFYSKDRILMERNSKPLMGKDVIIEKDEVTDGIVAFRPLQGWKCDTIIGNDKEGYAYHYITDDSTRIYVSSVLGECRSRIDYYELLEGFGFPDTLAMKELSFKDSIISGNRYYQNIYCFKDDEDTVYLTLSALKDNSSYKMMTMSTVEINKHGLTDVMADSFMKDVRFKLEQR